MASGKLLILLGDECRKRAEYLGLDKEYVIEVALGAATDTGDALGLATLAPSVTPTAHSELERALSSLIGSHTVPYPAFSSKTVQGKPLFQYALEGTLESISIPEHTETIYKITMQRVEELTATRLLDRIQKTISRVPRSDEPSKVLGADFRQDIIRTRWNELLGEADTDTHFTIVTLRVTCASGAYMRTLAKRLGSVLGTRGFALSIHRSKIGRYRRLGPLSWWSEFS